MPTLSSAINASASALSAERTRIEVAVSNMANAESTRGPDGQPYRRRDVVLAPDRTNSFDAALGKAGAVGVSVAAIVEDAAPFRRRHEPSHPDADAEGFVMVPNVDPQNEMVDLLGASRAFRARRFDHDGVQPFAWTSPAPPSVLPRTNTRAAAPVPAAPAQGDDTAAREAHLVALTRDAFSNGFAQGERAGGRKQPPSAAKRCCAASPTRWKNSPPSVSRRQWSWCRPRTIRRCCACAPPMRQRASPSTSVIRARTCCCSWARSHASRCRSVKWGWRGSSPTTKGFTPSVFALLPALLERAGAVRGRGSIPGMYTVLVDGDDHNESVADAVLAILEGHVVLSRDLAARHHYPPIDILQSVSRTMPDAIDVTHRRKAEQVREWMAAIRDSEDLVSVGATSRAAILASTTRGPGARRSIPSCVRTPAPCAG